MIYTYAAGMKRSIHHERTMMNTPPANLIEMARGAIGARTDNDLAARLPGTNGSTISAWRLGRAPMPDNRVLELVKLADTDAGYWLNAISADKARHTDVREAYREAAERLILALDMGEGDG